LSPFEKGGGEERGRGGKGWGATMRSCSSACPGNGPGYEGEKGGKGKKKEEKRSFTGAKPVFFEGKANVHHDPASLERKNKEKKKGRKKEKREKEKRGRGRFVVEDACPSH